MRIAIISDIHGNCLGLDTVLDDLQGDSVDRTICLGDAIQGGSQPALTVARLRELGCPVVMGNANAWLISGVDTSDVEQTTDMMAQVREWSLAQLSEKDIQFIESFQPTVEIDLPGEGKLLCFHGSPTSFDELIFPETPEEDFERMLGHFAPAIMCGGHTHLQQIRRLRDLFFFNPGSVGFAYNRNQPEDNFKADPWAEYAVLTVDEDGRISLDLRRVPFDPEKVVKIILKSGMPFAESSADRYR